MAKVIVGVCFFIASTGFALSLASHNRHAIWKYKLGNSEIWNGLDDKPRAKSYADFWLVFQKYLENQHFSSYGEISAFEDKVRNILKHDYNSNKSPRERYNAEKKMSLNMQSEKLENPLTVRHEDTPADAVSSAQFLSDLKGNKNIESKSADNSPDKKSVNVTDSGEYIPTEESATLQALLQKEIKSPNPEISNKSSTEKEIETISKEDNSSSTTDSEIQGSSTLESLPTKEFTSKTENDTALISKTKKANSTEGIIFPSTDAQVNKSSTLETTLPTTLPSASSMTENIALPGSKEETDSTASSSSASTDADVKKSSLETALSTEDSTSSVIEKETTLSFTSKKTNSARSTDSSTTDAEGKKSSTFEILPSEGSTSSVIEKITPIKLSTAVLKKTSYETKSSADQSDTSEAEDDIYSTSPDADKLVNQPGHTVRNNSIHTARIIISGIFFAVALFAAAGLVYYAIKNRRNNVQYDQVMLIS